MNIESLRGKVHDSWLPLLRPFVETKAMDDIYEFLRSEKTLGKSICPNPENVFRSFEIDVKSIKCIVVLQDPYFTKGVGNGIPMDCSNTGKMQPSLKLWYKGIEDSYGKTGKKVVDVDDPTNLKYLLDQGVFLINAALTVEEEQPRSHQKIWRPFMEFVFREIIGQIDPCPIVYLGKTASELDAYLPPFLHYSKMVEHPAAASYKKKPWNYDNMFEWINYFLKSNNKTEIKWLGEKEE